MRSHLEAVGEGAATGSRLHRLDFKPAVLNKGE
jgi:hypothetical protein